MDATGFRSAAYKDSAEGVLASPTVTARLRGWRCVLVVFLVHCLMYEILLSEEITGQFPSAQETTH